MTVYDSKSGPGPTEQGEPLSATGMFLRAFDEATEQPQEQTEADLAKSVAPVAPPTPAVSGPFASGPSSSGPGEFTQLFQTLEPRKNPAPTPVAAQTPQVPSQPVPKTEQQVPTVPGPAPTPGEFTRIFVKASAPPPEASAKTAVEHTPQAANPSRMKGFSTPGASDSASAEGSFTQFFKAASPAPTPATPPPTQAFTPSVLTSQAPPQRANDWPRESNLGAGARPFDLGLDMGQSPAPASNSTPTSGSATGLLSSLSSPGGTLSAPRQPEPAPFRPEPISSFSPAPPPAEPSHTEAGSVTRLIERLSQVPREAPPEPFMPPTSAPFAAAPTVSASSGPGEFTQMISGSAVRAAATPTAPAPAAIAQVAPPQAPAIAAPAIKAPAAPAAPKVEPPKVEAPKLAPPAVAAPKSKLEAMVPIFLVVNTFLLIVLLVVVIFAMKAK